MTVTPKKLLVIQHLRHWIKHIPNPYKTCRLFIILDPLSQKNTLGIIENHYFYKHPVTDFRDVENPSYSLVKHGSPYTVKSSTWTFIKPVTYWWFWSPWRENDTKSSGKHYVYKHSVMHFRDLENPWYCLGKPAFSQAAKPRRRTLINPVVYWWIWTPCAKRTPNQQKKY